MTEDVWDNATIAVLRRAVSIAALHHARTLDQLATPDDAGALRICWIMQACEELGYNTPSSASPSCCAKE